VTEAATFPFGRPSTARPPRRPAQDAALFVLGVYPSALHVRWSPPAWARSELGVGPIGALAVDDEPVVFWDGADASERVAVWRDLVGFRDGDDRDGWGRVSVAGNGTSGRSVAERVVTPLRAAPESTWFTDVVDRYFVKSGGAAKRQQANAIAADYAPFAEAAALPVAQLPPRPSIDELVRLAITDHASRLRAELVASAAPVVVTIGEEARRVLVGVADASAGPPTRSLSMERPGLARDYGEAGTVSVDGCAMSWRALVHPGQRSVAWTAVHDAWIDRRRSD
jgi:hypothetical protein